MWAGRVGSGHLEEQSRVIMETTLRPFSTQTRREVETTFWSTAGQMSSDCAVPEGSCGYMSLYLSKWKCLKSFFCECVTVNQRCLDRETLIYDIWHQLWLNCRRCFTTVAPQRPALLALREPSLNPDRYGWLWIHLHNTTDISFFPPPLFGWLTDPLIGLVLHVYWKRFEKARVSKKIQKKKLFWSCVGTGHSCWCRSDVNGVILIRDKEDFYLPPPHPSPHPADITPVYHWPQPRGSAEPAPRDDVIELPHLFPFCIINRSVLFRCDCAVPNANACACVYASVRACVWLHFLCVSFTDHSLCVWL